MSKLFDALTRSLLEKYPADWLNQLGLIHGEPVRVMNSDLSPGWSTSSSRRVTIVHFLGDSYGTMRC